MMIVLGSKLAGAGAEPPPSPRRAPNLPEVLASKLLRNTVALLSAIAFACYAFRHASVADFYAAATAAAALAYDHALIEVGAGAMTKVSTRATPVMPSFEGPSSPLPTTMIFASAKTDEVREEDTVDDSEDRWGDGSKDEEDAKVDWSRFAYTQYVTDIDYLCNSIMLFESLHRLESKPDRVLLYPSDMMDSEEMEPKTRDARLLVQARDKYAVKLLPVSVQHRDAADKTWSESYTKLLIFNLTHYDRVLHLDSDSTVLEPMDELFLLPPSPVAMPKAYWFDDDRRKLFTTGVMLVQPSEHEFSRIMSAVEAARKEEYDMEIVNNLFGDSADVLPHRPYPLVSGEFRANSHEKYLRRPDSYGGDDVGEEWDATDVFNEAKFVHFSDWPVAKPWRYNSPRFKGLQEPKCEKMFQPADCSGQRIWNWLYEDFASRRKSVCGLDLVKKKLFAFQPEWSKTHQGPYRAQLERRRSTTV